MDRVHGTMVNFPLMSQMIMKAAFNQFLYKQNICFKRMEVSWTQILLCYSEGSHHLQSIGHIYCTFNTSSKGFFLIFMDCFSFSHFLHSEFPSLQQLLWLGYCQCYTIHSPSFTVLLSSRLSSLTYDRAFHYDQLHQGFLCLTVS